MTLDEARVVLSDDIQDSGGLFCLGRYLAWTPGTTKACLDADFTADELEAIAVWMRESVKDRAK